MLLQTSQDNQITGRLAPPVGKPGREEGWEKWKFMSERARRCNIAKWREQKVQICIFISDTGLYFYRWRCEQLHWLKRGRCVCRGCVGLLLFIRSSWGSRFFFFFSCPSTSGPRGVQTLHPGNGTVKLLQLSNRIHRLRCSSESTSVRSIHLTLVQVCLFSSCFHVCGRSTTSPSAFSITPFLSPCFWTFVQV